MMMKNYVLPMLGLATLLTGCIKDDLIEDAVDPVLRITSRIDTIAFNSSFQFESMYLNNVGAEEEVTVDWQSSNADVVSIDANGNAKAMMEGSTTITAEFGDLKDMIEVHVGKNTVVVPKEKGGTIKTTSTYELSGDFTVEENEGNLVISFSENYVASTALPGLYVYISNNRNTVANAIEIGAVEVFSGEHTYSLPGIGLNDYQYLVYFCKPFNIKVGDGEIE